MKLIAQLFAATALVAGLNNAFADGRKEAVLDMGKGGFKLTVSVPEDRDGPYDFAKNPGIGKAMSGQFQTQEVMFGGKLNDTSNVIYQATAQRIDPNKKGQKLTAEHMAQDQIKAEGFKDKAVRFECPPHPLEGAASVCYKMSGDAVFDGKARSEKYASFLISVSWNNDTQGYTLMGTCVEKDVEKFVADPSVAEKRAYNAFGSLWKYHKVTKN